MSASAAAPSVSILDQNNRLHRALAYFNRRRLAPALPRADWSEARREDESPVLLEANFIEHDRRAVAAAACVGPPEADAFVKWFERLTETGPGQGDPLFPWL